MIGISVLVGFITSFGDYKKPIEPYLFMTAMRSTPRIPTEEEMQRIAQENREPTTEEIARLFGYYDHSLPEIRGRFGG